VLEDEPPHVFLADEIDIPALLFGPFGSSQLCPQVAGLNPASDDVRIDKFHEKYGAKDVKKYYSKFDVAAVVELD
jgi:hypothetical protein